MAERPTGTKNIMLRLDPELAERLQLFGRLVGSWDVSSTHFHPDGTVKVERRGEWHFGWVLEGRAIQDVLISPPLADRDPETPSHEYGTTLRAYDARIDRWRVTYVAPVYGATVNLVAREVDDEIWLEGSAPDGKLLRWTFSEITETAFRWQGYESADGGLTWFRDEQILCRRRGR